MDLIFSFDGPVARIHLNRPEKRNALTGDMCDEIAAQVARIAADPQARAVLLTAEGVGFCAGADITGSPLRERSVASTRAGLARYQAAIAALHNLDKPVVAAVRGAVVGIGWSLALASDAMLLSETARFCMRFLERGQAPDGGAIHLLTRHLGEYRTKEIAFSSRWVDAAEAVSLGIATRLVRDDDLDATALELAHRLAAGPTVSIGLTKQLFHQRAASLADYHRMELLAVALSQETTDAAEGKRAFAERRPPVFEGK